MSRTKATLEALSDTAAELSWWSLINQIVRGCVALVQMFASH